MEYRYKEMIKNLSVKGSVFGLSTMENLLETLGHPEEELKIIHTAGTNGKGSTLAFLAGILKESGYRVGRYISPTIQCYEERFQIDDIFIREELLESYFLKIDQAIKIMEKNGSTIPTIFEVETAIALLYFRDEKVDYALLEVGMGGLLDATNAIRKTTLSIITSISEDHKAILGDTIEKIAEQKAGIIKERTPVILAINRAKVEDVVKRTATKKKAALTLVKASDLSNVEETPFGNTFVWEKDSYSIGLPGAHQVENATTALTAAKHLRENGANLITTESMKNGLKKTRWPGRLELLSQQPLIYLDGAHNPDGARKLADFLEKHFTNKTIIYIMGVLGDKEYPIMLSYLMPLAKEAYVFAPKNARGLEAESLAQAMEIYRKPVHICDGILPAKQQALKEHPEADCFVICGSLSFIEEMRKEEEGDTISKKYL